MNKKQFLLILDDMWDEDENMWIQLSNWKQIV